MSATYTVKQVAEILGYSTNSIYTFLKEKRIKGVRVGTGRFRIPQGELNRLLGEKNPQVPREPETVPLRPTATQPSIVSISSLFGSARVGIPNIFDWFLGVVTVVGGLSMFLFNKSFDTVIFAKLNDLIGIVRIACIGGGMGVLVTNVFALPNSRWRNIFKGILICGGIGLTYYYWRYGDIAALVAFAVLSLVTIATMIWPLGGLLSFTFFVSLLAIGAAVTLGIAPDNNFTRTFFTIIPLSRGLLTMFASIVAIVLLTVLWWGYRRNRKAFGIAMWVLAIGSFALSLWYAQGQNWGRAFFFIITGIACFLVNPWEQINTTKHHREHFVALGVFGGMFAALLLGVAVVYLLQRAVLETVKREDIYKVMYARTAMESALDTTKTAITGASLNVDMAEAIKVKDMESMTNLARIIYESNTSLRRVAFFDAAGAGLTIYPYGTLDAASYANRDYFVRARDTGGVVISDLFEGQADHTYRKVVVVAAPVYSSTHTFLGVIIGSLNLEGIGARLQKIAVPERGEYIVVADTNGKYIIHPSASLIGTDTEKSDPIRFGISGDHGVAEALTYDGVRAVVAYDTVDDIHWGIAINSPITESYHLANMANVTIFVIILILVLTAIGLLGVVHRRNRKQELPGEGSSP